MSDEHEQRRDTRPDETQQYAPFEDDDQTRMAGSHPEEGLPPNDGWTADRTQQMPGQGDNGTAVMPAAGDWDAPDAPWSGRAEVRPPLPAGYGTTMADWAAVPPPEEPRGKWWMPILVGILALILLGLLGWGIYLILQNSANNEDTPAPTPSASAPTTTSPTTEPTTTPPTTPPTTQPTQTSLTVPALVGLSQEEAQEALDRSGLTYRLIFRASDAAPGTVIDSDPAEGQQVPPDTQVTLVIAAEPQTEPGTPPTDQPDED